MAAGEDLLKKFMILARNSAPGKAGFRQFSAGHKICWRLFSQRRENAGRHSGKAGGIDKNARFFNGPTGHGPVVRDDRKTSCQGLDVGIGRGFIEAHVKEQVGATIHFRHPVTR